MKRLTAIYAVSAALALMRIHGVSHEAFQAVAHLWVGGLGGAWLITRDQHYARVVILLSIVEIVCFLASRL